MNGRETWRSPDRAVVITARHLTLDERQEYPLGTCTRVTIRQTTGKAKDGRFYDVRCHLLIYKWSSLQTCLDMGVKYYNKYMAPRVGRPYKHIYEQPHQKTG